MRCEPVSCQWLAMFRLLMNLLLKTLQTWSDWKNVPRISSSEWLRMAIRAADHWYFSTDTGQQTFVQRRRDLSYEDSVITVLEGLIGAV
jgi:hypothetical protein